MTLFNPSGLAWVLLAVPIVVLHLVRVRPRRRSVPAGFLWDRVFSTDRPRAAWWPWRGPVSLFVELAILALVVLALAEPLLRRPQRLVLIIDNSASMNATDAAPTRLDRAKEFARQRVAELGSRDQMAILSAGGPPAVLCGLTDRQDLLEKAVEAVSPTRAATRVQEAVTLGRGLLADSPDGKVLLLTDGCFDGLQELAAADDVEFIPVGAPAGNVAVTELAARRSLRDLSACQILVRAANFSDEPVACRVEIEMEGEPIVDVPAHLPAAGRWQRMFEITTAAGGRIFARLDTPDVLPEDNCASTLLLRAASPGPIGSLQPWLVASGGGIGDSWAAARPVSAWPGAAESDLRVPASFTSRAKGAAAEGDQPPVWPFPAAAAALLVVLQWCLYQRRWVC